MKKVLLTATVQSHICQFHKPLVEVLHQNGYEVHVAARDNLAEKNGLALDFVEKVYNVPFSRSPKSIDNIKAYKQLKKIIDDGGYEVVHCNTPMGGIVTRLAAKKARKGGTKVFYTAHGFHFYNGASKKNWMVFYPIERFFARYTDKLITIVNEDYELALSKFKCPVYHIHGVGVNPERFHPVDDREKLALRENLNLSSDDFAILCTGELNKNKNQAQLIEAAYLLKDKLPNLKILLAGNGPNEEILRELISYRGLESVVKLLGYRTDLEKLVPAVDLIVSVSHREGMPLNIIEAMLCKKPIIATANRGHKELVTDNKNGFIIPVGDAHILSEKIYALSEDEKLRQDFSENAYKMSESYQASNVKNQLRDIYLS